MEKRILDVKLVSEHGMPEGSVGKFHSKLKEFIGEKYDYRHLTELIRKFGESDVFSKPFIFTGYGYHASPEKDNQATFTIVQSYANVKFDIELEDVV